MLEFGRVRAIFQLAGDADSQSTQSASGEDVTEPLVKRQQARGRVMPDMQAGARIGPYRVESVLPGNRGGFAQVVVARRVSGGSEHETVAVKIARTDSAAGIDAEAFARALGSEVETLRVLKHPGIVRLFPIQLDDRRYSYMARADNLPGRPWYYVMEYLAGGTAEDLVREQRSPGSGAGCGNRAPGGRGAGLHPHQRLRAPGYQDQ